MWLVATDISGPFRLLTHIGLANSITARSSRVTRLTGGRGDEGTALWPAGTLNKDVSDAS